MRSDTKSITTVNIELPEGNNIILSSKKKGFVPSYYRICQGNIYREGNIMKQSLDAYELMSTFTPQEWYVLNTLKQIGFVHYDTKFNKHYSSNIISTKSLKLNSTQKNQFSTGYKRLNSKNIIKRIKRQLYIINPDFQIPTNYKNEKETYEQLT